MIGGSPQIEAQASSIFDDTRKWERIRVPIEIKEPQNDHFLTILSPIFKRIPFIYIILEHSGKKNN